jgi:3',5'-cyclic AMP phosphodiesterase CpdA
MPRVVWATDIHLEFCSPARVDAFVAEVSAATPAAVVLAGDTSTAARVATTLRRLEERFPCPVYFVLGNHDCYGGSIGDVREQAAALTGGGSRLRWLPSVGVVALSDATALVGVDGWADGRCGDYWSSTVQLNDFRLIAELTGLDAGALLRRLHGLGDAEAALLRWLLAGAVRAHRRVVVVTHVPPFGEAAWHEGRPSAPEWAPFFACRATGEALLEAADARPDVELLVLCGHTHGAGEYTPRPNLRVVTGAAAYGDPRSQGVLLLP